LKIENIFSNWDILHKILSCLERKERVWIRGIGGTPLSLLLFSLFSRLSSRIIVVGEKKEVAMLHANLKEFLPENTIFYGENATQAPQKGLSSLHRLINSEKIILFTTPHFLKERIVSPREISAKTAHMKNKATIERSELLKHLQESGYERVERVEMPGEWSVRGGIVDIFSPSAEKPYRVELEENRIISLRAFDPYTQKSLYYLEEIVIPHLHLEQAKRESCLLEYLTPGDLVVLHDTGNIKKTIAQAKSKEEVSWGEVLSHLSSLRVMLTSWLPQSPPLAYHALFSLSFQSLKGITLSFNTLYNSLKRWEREKFRIFIAGFSGIEKKRFQEIIEHKAIKKCEFIPENLQEGFLSEDLKIVLITTREILGYQPLQKATPQSIPISYPCLLEENDYVVHAIHGIGKFVGLREEKVEGEKKEFLVIEYAGGDLLYVPVEGLHLVEKYIGVEGSPPSLSKLGSPRWRKTREKVKSAIKDLSANLLHTQALRQSQTGFTFSKDQEWQKEFESTFPYKETPDQIKAIEEVKQDMESSSPMERLICGDTGFGKTEVALRAAFKACLDGKQVAMLTPTTLLTHQHYINFTERLKDFPIKVEMLSRFVSNKKKQQILKELEEGKIDIIIGTHLLIQEKVKFKDLGLLIIDEEHRFGVKHKEKIKQMKNLVDILSLSATPIPRTLYLALSGIRELSLILTPPPERLEVLTEVREFNLQLIKEAIEREIERKGQVFFVHNRIEDLESFREIIRKLVPRAKSSIIHGQMNSKNIEKEMIKFIKGEIDVLITTTIIASGLDIPNANTIIVNEAHKFGLAELYQLRGRVGRYKTRAHAYFLVPPREILSHEARRKLYAIQTFAHLGSGYQLALEDLQIRGAGNILGEEQHGHIQAVGLALYTELLSRTIAELKGETYLPYIPTKIEAGISVSLPSALLSEKEKLSYYKRLSQAKEKEEIDNIKKELEDRLGTLPEEAMNLFEIQKIKLLAFRKGIEYIRKRKNLFLIRFFPEITLQQKGEILHAQKPGRVLITPQGELGYIIKERKKTLTLLKELLTLLPDEAGAGRYPVASS